MKMVVRKIMDPQSRTLPLGHDLEWLVTNGLGGYASGTVSGKLTRRYHGLLVAALPGSLGRVVMLSKMLEEIHHPNGRVVEFGAGHYGATTDQSGGASEFRLEMGLPVWRYETDGIILEKRLHMPYRQNTSQVTYRFLACVEPCELLLRPLIQFRGHETPVDARPESPYVLSVVDEHYEVSVENLPPLRLYLRGRGKFTVERKRFERIRYPLEGQRGYDSLGDLWTPGSFRVQCSGIDEITLIASTESWAVIDQLAAADAWKTELERRDRLIAFANPKARAGTAAELVLAADQFIVTPSGQSPEVTRAYAAGDDVRIVIAGYHWFTDWGRDTMISLEGLTLATRRFLEAGWILRNFASTIHRGLIPNLFPEGSREGLYHTADATLWFFHAIERYVRATEDRWTLNLLLPRLIDIVEQHIQGTLFGIGVDPEDGLLRQGEEHYQLTWMDAKVGDWVVTPRRGKAVEINALWYNALRLLQQWLAGEDSSRAGEIRAHADRARESFNRRFWFSAGGYLYDVVDGENGDDSSCRPNQLLAISLDHPILDASRWRPVLDTVRERLLTPVGLRSLEPGGANYKSKYFGDLRARDAAYHQGTVWPWLIGPMVDAWLKVFPDDVAGARALLQGLIVHLDEACIGTISEIADAESPCTPRGCISQAWSVAEVLRCWVKTAAGQEND